MKKTIELHILQAIVNGGVNRDENGSLKTTHLGGYDRMRVSSQSWKRAIRLYAKTINPELFGGIRTRYLPGILIKSLVEAGLNKGTAEEVGPKVAGILANGNIDPKNPDRVKGMAYISTSEINHVTQGIATDSELLKSLKGKIAKKTQGKVMDLWSHAPMSADVALFGRMVADFKGCSVEAASQYSHAVGVDRLDRDFDFFSAVDDLQPSDESGAGYTDLREIGSSVVYRYAAIGLPQLSANLNNDDQLTIRETVKAWMEAVIMAMPTGNRTGQNTDTLPLHVVAVTQDSGRTVSASTAFVDPVRANRDGLTGVAVECLDAHLASARRFLPGMTVQALGADETMAGFIDQIVGG